MHVNNETLYMLTLFLQHNFICMYQIIASNNYTSDSEDSLQLVLFIIMESSLCKDSSIDDESEVLGSYISSTLFCPHIKSVQ